MKQSFMVLLLISKVDPGVTIVFVLRLQMGDLRWMWCRVAVYVGVSCRDVGLICVLINQFLQILNNMYELSQWTAEYLTASVFMIQIGRER